MVRRAAALAILPALLAASPAAALDPQRPFSGYTVRVWQLKDGMPGDSVRALAQTSDGYLWVAALGGVARFDGVAFQRLDSGDVAPAATRTNLDIARLHAGRDGSLWVGASFREPFRYRAGELIDFARGRRFDGRAVAFADEAEGAVVVAGQRALYRHAGNRDAPFERIEVEGLERQNVAAMRFDRGGRLWIGTDKGLGIVEGGRLRRWLGPTGPIDSAVHAIHQSRDGVIWVSVRDGLLRIDGETTTRLTEAQGLPPKTIHQLLEDREGTLWLASGAGLGRLRGDRLTLYTKEDGLPDDDVTALLEDREGSLWLGTREGGLAQITDRTVVATDVPPGLESTSIETLCEDGEGAIWFGTARQGAVRWKDGVATRLGTDEGLPSNNIQSLYPGADGGLWIATPRGVRFWRRGELSVPFELPQASMLFVDRRKTVWAGTGNRLAQFRDGSLRLFDRADGLPGGQVRYLEEDAEGALWVSSVGGVARLRDGRFERIGREEGTRIHHPRSIVRAHDGALWFSTSGGGLARFTNGRFPSVGEAHGLPTSILYQMVEDAAGDFWIGTHKGVFRVTRPSVEEVMAGRRPFADVVSFETTDRREGVVVARNRQPTAWRARDGRVWFAAERGALAIDPKRIPQNRVPPPVVIQKTVVDGQPLLPAPDTRFAPGTRTLEVHYAALAYLEPHKARHRYKLDGFDDRWVDAGPRRIAYYTNLPPRRYTFRVQGSNNDGVWNETGASVRFEVEPRFHQTLWFYGACALFVAGLAFVGHRARLRGVRQQYVAVLSERTRMARELHDTLLQGMSAAAMQIHGVHAQLRPEDDGLRRQLASVGQMITDSLDETRRAVWNLREQEVGVGDLGEAFRRLCERLATPARVAWAVDVQGTPRPLSHEAQDELFRVGREAIANALKHAAPGRIDVTVTYGPEEVVLAVADDGRGFDPQAAEPAGHFGLQGLRERAARLGGKLAIDSRAGAGTRLEMRVPAPGRS